MNSSIMAVCETSIHSPVIPCQDMRSLLLFIMATRHGFTCSIYIALLLVEIIISSISTFSTRVKYTNGVIHELKDADNSIKFAPISCSLSSSMGLGHQKRKFFKSRVAYYSGNNCTASRQLLNRESIKTLLSGDIQTNPGPVKNPCSVCEKPVARTHRSVTCNQCEKKCHIGLKCGNIPVNTYLQSIGIPDFPFMCPTCRNTTQNAVRQPLHQGGQQIQQSDFCNPFSMLQGQNNFLKIGSINVNGLRGKLNEI